MSIPQSQQAVRRKLSAEVWVVAEPGTDCSALMGTKDPRGEGLSHAWGRKRSGQGPLSPGSQTLVWEFEEAENCEFEPVLSVCFKGKDRRDRI